MIHDLQTECEVDQIIRKKGRVSSHDSNHSSRGLDVVPTHHVREGHQEKYPPPNYDLADYGRDTGAVNGRGSNAKSPSISGEN